MFEKSMNFAFVNVLVFKTAAGVIDPRDKE